MALIESYYLRKSTEFWIRLVLSSIQGLHLYMMPVLFSLREKNIDLFDIDLLLIHRNLHHIKELTCNGSLKEINVKNI